MVDHVEVDGLGIAFRHRGEGPPLVLLHGGFGFDGRQWEPQLDQLSDEFTVVAWDSPGHGRSSDPPEHFRLPDYADCLAGFIDALKLERPHIVGLSFGGGLALQFHDRHPTVARSLVLCGAYAGWAGSLPPEVVRARLDRVLRESELPPDQWLPAYMPGMFHETAPPELLDHALSISTVHPVGLRVGLTGFAEADLRDVLPRVDVPTLLLWGEGDQRSSLSIAHEMHARIPDSTLVVLPRAGHVSNLEVPAAFNDALRAFLHEQSG